MIVRGRDCAVDWARQKLCKVEILKRLFKVEIVQRNGPDKDCADECVK